MTARFSAVSEIIVTFIKQYAFAAKQPSSAISLLLHKQYLLMFLTRNFLFRVRNKKLRIGNKSFLQGRGMKDEG